MSLLLESDRCSVHNVSKDENRIADLKISEAR